jgi:predicted SAM-dependent methyltransferase
MSETLKAHIRRLNDGFYVFVNGKTIIDVGYAATGGETMPDQRVIGIDLNTPGYDGSHLPFEDNSQEVIYSSHMLEHTNNDMDIIKDQYRCLKPGGFLIIYVPHQWLYEKKGNLPSRFNHDHRSFYTPAKLLRIIEDALPLREYRLRRCMDCDTGFDYKIPDDQHSTGEYAIECIIEKLKL